MADESPFAKVDHIGVIVKDVDRAVQYYESLGIGPFEKGALQMAYRERTLMGKPFNDDRYKLAIRLGKMGQVKVELIQPVEGDSPWKEFLDTKGEGIMHIAFAVDDIDAEQAKLEDEGLSVIYSSRFQNGGGAAYIDTREVGGMITELVQWPPG